MIRDVILVSNLADQLRRTILFAKYGVFSTDMLIGVAEYCYFSSNVATTKVSRSLDG